VDGPRVPANNPFSYDEDTGTSLLRAEYSNKQFQLGLQKSFGAEILRK
jgi:hypothetical protein